MEDIIIREVYRAFGEKEVLHGFSARLQAGTITGLMAPSGSGKTTLLRILMGLDRPQQGKITGLDGLRVSAVFQEDRLCENLNAVANIRLVTPVLTLETVEASLKAVGLGDSSRQPVRELSGGQKRRVAILRALLAEYDLLLLDEPFRGLDAATKQVVLTDTLTRCAGRTVLLVTHDSEELDAMGVTNRLSL
mgnify:FL=1